MLEAKPLEARNFDRKKDREEVGLAGYDHYGGEMQPAGIIGIHDLKASVDCHCSMLSWLLGVGAEGLSSRWRGERQRDRFL